MNQDLIQPVFHAYNEISYNAQRTGDCFLCGKLIQIGQRVKADESGIRHYTCKLKVHSAYA